MKNYFMMFDFANGDYHVGIGYQSDKDMTDKIREFVSSYQYKDDAEYEDIIADAMNNLNIETWCVMPMAYIKVA